MPYFFVMPLNFSKLVEMEAAYLKLNSNHLIILQEMQKPQIGKKTQLSGVLLHQHL